MQLVQLLVYACGLLATGGAAMRDTFSRARRSNSTGTATYTNSTIIDGKAWDTAALQASNFVSQLTLDEKITLVTGDLYDFSGTGCVGNIPAIPRVGFNGLCLQDGATAVNYADLVSIFPAGLTAATTWDIDLIQQRGLALGEEFRAKGAHVMLGPVAEPLGRNPLGGRNWEGFGPDPYLNGKAMYATIQGVQSVGVQTCAKHFLGYEQETQRLATVTADNTTVLAYSSNIGSRTLRELYLWPFADAVRAGSASLMCSYNRVNETYACENSALLKDILRDELGFRGYVVSDWNGLVSTSPSANAGTDLEMPGIEIDGVPYYYGSHLSDAVAAGEVTEDRVTEMCERIMAGYYLLGQNSSDYPTPDPSNPYILVAQELGYGDFFDEVVGLLGAAAPGRDVRDDHASIIRTVGAAGTVLLKNDGGVLPLKAKAMNIGVFGNDAADMTTLSNLEQTQTGHPYGTLDIGGGSGIGRHTTIVSPLEAIKAKAASDGGSVQYITSNTILAANDFSSIYPVPDVCIVFLKTWATETLDRLSFELDWDSTEVVDNVAAFCPTTIVVTHSAGVNTLPWASNSTVQAILAAHYPGEQTGNSIVDVLWGDVEPTGRLPYTIPEKEEDYNFPVLNLTGSDADQPNAWQADYTEGLLIDYRHFDAYNITPLYEFGYGLGYTTFEISSSLASTKLFSSCKNSSLMAFPKNSTVELGGNPDLWVDLVQTSTTVTNTGSTAGSTVVQLYLSYPTASVPSGTPVKVLRGFQKLLLQPGEQSEVKFLLTRRDLSYWDVDSSEWRIPAGSFSLQVGFSSRDLPESATLQLLS